MQDAETAYTVLRGHLRALDEEWREAGLATEVDTFETRYLEEQTTKEVGSP